MVTSIPTLKETYQRNRLKGYALMITSEGTALIGNFVITIAGAIGFITLVNALSSVQPLFLLLMMILMSLFKPHILKEELGGSVLVIKFIAIGMILAGVYLIG